MDFFSGEESRRYHIFIIKGVLGLAGLRAYLVEVRLALFFFKSRFQYTQKTG